MGRTGRQPRPERESGGGFRKPHAKAVHGLLLLAAVALPLALTGLSAWTSWRDAWRGAKGEMRRDADAVADHAARLLDGHRRAAEQLERILRGVSGLDMAARQRRELGEALHALLAGPTRSPAWGHAGPEGAGRDEATGDMDLALDAALAAESLALLAGEPEDSVLLLRSDGAILARAPSGDAPPVPDRLDPASPLLSLLRQGEERGMGRVVHDGEEELVAYRRVPGWPLHAVVLRPVAAITAGWRADLGMPLALGLGSASLLATLALLVRRNQQALLAANARLEQHVAERTAEAAQAMAAMRAGDERLRLAIEAVGFGGWEMDLRTGLLTRTGRVVPVRPDLPLSGYTLEAYLDTVVHPEDRDRVRGVIADIRAQRCDRYRIEYRVRGHGGGWAWMESCGSVVERDATGAPVRLAGVARDVTERRAAEAALRASEARLRVAIEAARFSTWEYDVRADRGARQGLLARTVPQLPEAGFRLADWLAEVHPEDRPAAEAAIAGLIHGEEEQMRMEFRVRRPGGGWIFVESAGAVAERDPRTGAVLRLAGVARDVTEQRAAAQRQALLAREVDHRAKNALAVVQAALRLTPRTDAASYAEAVEGRVRALARAHTLLADARWEGASLKALAAAELAAFLPEKGDAAGQAARAALQGPELTLAPAAAQGLSMALHELATNATKHGALSTAGGRVALTWEVDEAASMLRLRWEERGGPPVPAEPSRRGFGSRVVEATVRDQLGGRLTRHWQAGGLVCEIEVPLARALVGPAVPCREAEGGARALAAAG